MSENSDLITHSHAPIVPTSLTPRETTTDSEHTDVGMDARRQAARRMPTVIARGRQFQRTADAGRRAEEVAVTTFTWRK